MRDNSGKTKNVTKKSKSQMGAATGFQAANLRNFAGAAKFRNPCEIAKVHSFHSTAFLLLGCSALQLDSSCLD